MTGVILLILLLIFGIPLILLIAGLRQYKKNREGAMVFFIICGVYLLVTFGICATM